MEKDAQEWMERIRASGKSEHDLSRDEDLAIAIMNLISLEEHFYFTAMKTDREKYLDMLHGTRALRQKLLKKIVLNPQGEEWCISKHLLASSMRLIEVGTKELSNGKKKEANSYFTAAFELFSLFFAINLGIADESSALPMEHNLTEEKASGVSAIMKKILNCCKEW